MTAPGDGVGDDRRTERALEQVEGIEDQIQSLEYVIGEARKVTVGGATFAVGSTLGLLGLLVREVTSGAAVDLSANATWWFLLSACLVVSLGFAVGGWFQQRHYLNRVERMEEDLMDATSRVGGEGWSGRGGEDPA